MSNKWYLVQVRSNFENRFKLYIQDLIKEHGFNIDDIALPTVKEKNSVKKIYPGYILIKCDDIDQIYNYIRTFDQFIRFLGYGGQPYALTEDEAQNMLDPKIEQNKDQFEIGQAIVIKSGLFQFINGTIVAIHANKKRLSIEVEALGRSTRLDLDFDAVEHV